MTVYRLRTSLSLTFPSYHANSTATVMLVMGSYSVTFSPPASQHTALDFYLVPQVTQLDHVSFL